MREITEKNGMLNDPIIDITDSFIKDTFIKNILNDIKSVKDNLPDISSRKAFLHRSNKNINALWDFVSGDDFSKNLVIALADGINNIKAENLNFGQLDVIKGIIEVIRKGKITEDELDSCMKLLIDNDIPLVLLPANISDLYD